MKKMIAILLTFLGASFSSKPADLIFNLISSNFCMDSLPVKNQISVQKKLKTITPFQGKKTFCSADNDAKYFVTIKGNNVFIAIGNIKITGLYKKDKLFTNDPGEIEYRKFAPKNNYGKYYVIGIDYFSILNSENSEYRYFTLCN